MVMKLNLKSKQQIALEKKIAENPTLQNFIGDIDYIGDSLHLVLEPCSFSVMFWNNAKQVIWETLPEERSAIIKSMVFAVGQVLSCYNEPIGHRIQKTKNVIGLFERFAEHLKIEISCLPYEIKKGLQCGPFDENDKIPEFLIDAWKEAKREIVEPANKPQVPILPEEAGNFADFITDSEGTLHPLPYDVFHQDIQHVIKEIAKTKSVPESMVVGILLALGSACIGRARGLRYRDDWCEHANLYMLLIAETGSGKSHTFDYIFRHVRKHEAKQKAVFKAARRQYEEDLLMFRKSKDANKVPPKKPANIQFLLDDTTMEAVSERLEDNPKGLFWTKDEFAGFFNSLDKYNKGGSDGKNRLLQAWNVGPWSASRKTKDGDMQERYIPNGCIGMFGNVQPHLLKNLFTYDDVNQGLPQRFLYLRAIIDKPMLLPTPELSKETDSVIQCITEKLLSLEMKVDHLGSTETSYLTLSVEAKEVFEEFNNLMQQKSFGLGAQGFSTKLAQMTLRIALILHFLNWGRIPMEEDKMESYCSSEIEYFTMYNAVRLVNGLWSHTQFARAYFPNAMETKAISQTETDEKKRTILKFVYKNETFCSEWRGASELIDAGLKWERGERSLGSYLTKNQFKKTPAGDKYTKYKLLPVPKEFA